ncbi:MAG: ribonuclease III [Candidatus Nomurabacteria bacterium]|nr:MAG: ribonuclease III [Candidatus Nomurabacteria bacterium]HRV76046.1 ribonuclease III [Candidatus Saccharimonadales bacterium]
MPRQSLKPKPQEVPHGVQSQKSNQNSGIFFQGVDMSDYQTFCKEIIKKEFSNLGLLLNAFTHRSYVNEHKKSKFKNNERLEFLGDAVLELAVTRYLYSKYPDEPEGVLTAWRSALVRTESIGAVADALEMDKLLRLSKGEKLNLERSRLQILANTFEAFVGALYLEFGFGTAEQFISDNLLTKTQTMIETESWRDPKSILQELAQSKFGVPPVYRVLDEYGPDHDKSFTLGAFIKGKIYGQGTGHSKQTAQQAAASKALEELGA